MVSNNTGSLLSRLLCPLAPGIIVVYSVKTQVTASLVPQWLGVCLPMQGKRVPALVREDPTCRRAAGPMRHNYWVCALEPASHNYWACVPQLLSPHDTTTEARTPRACALQQERPLQWEARTPQWGVDPARGNWRGPARSNKDPMQPNINK